MTFDGVRMRHFVGGGRVAEHMLPAPGPASKNGGLVIGGHREGEGRSYDEPIDEIAVWSRFLGPEEIAALQFGEGH